MSASTARPWIAALLVWAAIIFTLSSFPNPPGPRATELRSVVAHLAEYAIFGFLALNVIARWRGALTRRVVLTAWFLAIAYGISDELHQAFVPNRHASPFDVAVDTVGGALGVAVAAHWLRGRLPPAPGITRIAAPPGPGSPRSAR